MSPLDRLLAEAIPTRPAPVPHRPNRHQPHSDWTQQEQDGHWQALCHAIGSPNETRPTDSVNARQNAA